VSEAERTPLKLDVSVVIADAVKDNVVKVKASVPLVVSTCPDVPYPEGVSVKPSRVADIVANDKVPLPSV
jgi:hypothetical protein